MLSLRNVTNKMKMKMKLLKTKKTPKTNSYSNNNNIKDLNICRNSQKLLSFMMNQQRNTRHI